jgi:hypothetical protein
LGGRVGGREAVAGKLVGWGDVASAEHDDVIHFRVSTITLSFGREPATRVLGRLLGRMGRADVIGRSGVNTITLSSGREPATRLSGRLFGWMGWADVIGRSGSLGGRVGGREAVAGKLVGWGDFGKR